jgi:hypothetical protein
MRNYDLITSNAYGKYSLPRANAKSNQNIDIRSLKVISLLSMQKKMAKDIFTLKKDGAKPPARRGCSAYASESDINSASGGSIFNLQFRLVRVRPGQTGLDRYFFFK